jgi:two-component system cell cycle response regulator DivK
MQQDMTTRRTILLVEDDDDTRRVYSVMLRLAGFDVVEAANGPDAVKLALEKVPDLILMDMNLPMLDGWEAARRIRSDAGEGVAPLLAFSAMIDSTADLRRHTVLFDGFIAKPVSPAELVRRVAAYVDLLGRSPKKPVSRARREPSGLAAPAGTA